MIQLIFQKIILISTLISVLALSACGDTGPPKNKLRREQGVVLETEKQLSPSNPEGVSCNRTPEVTESISTTLEKTDCSKVTAEDLKALVVLDLSNKNLTTLQPDDFDGLTALEQLYLDDNQLSTLPSYIFDGLSSLFLLSLSNNQLIFLPSNVFNKLSTLHTLSLHGNKFPSLPVNLFNKLTSLNDLYLQNNQLTSLPDNVFDGLISLKRLSLENNQLSSRRKEYLQQKLGDKVPHLSL